MDVIQTLEFDNENKQHNYEFVARDMDGELRRGFIVVERPWSMPSSSWTYWMYFNEYSSGDLCGGCSNLGFERVIVDPATIRPYNQIEEIKSCLEYGWTVKLVKYSNVLSNDDNTIAIIRNESEIPYELWM